MKHFAMPALFAALLLSGCSSPAAPQEDSPATAGSSGPAEVSTPSSQAPAPSSAVPSTAPSPKPLIRVPALAPQLERLDVQDDPMHLYFQGDLSAEEKVTQLRIYRAVAENLNADSPIYDTPTDASKAMYEDEVITRDLHKRNSLQTVWSPAQLDRRLAGFSHQVTGIYCPMRAQTQKALEAGTAQCWYTARRVVEGHTVSESTWTDVTGLIYNSPDEVQRVDVKLKKDGGIFKVDGMNFYVKAS